MKRFFQKIWTWILCSVTIAILVACSSPSTQLQVKPSTGLETRAAAVPGPLPAFTHTPGSIQRPTKPAESTKEKPPIQVWLSPAVPADLRSSLKLPSGFKVAAQFEGAGIRLDALPSGEANLFGRSSAWVYVLVAPFDTILDNVTINDITNAWNGAVDKDLFAGQPLLMSGSTKAALEVQLEEKANAARIQVIPEDRLLAEAWNRHSWAMIPFEKLEPRWKLLRVNGISPLDRSTGLLDYPLIVHFGLLPVANHSGLTDAAGVEFLNTNFDPAKMTSLVLTGTTALVRETAVQMEENGIDFPGQKVRDWLKMSDLIHISNEVSFYSKCPNAVPLRREMRFCSDPRYFGLLEDIGTNIIELTGNHLMDWGPGALQETLALYHRKGMKYYGGGANLDEANQPLKIEDHGNKLAFLGCNAMGPKEDWATADTPGSAPCELDQMTAQIHSLAGQGYIPIVTFQHFELDDFRPQSAQRIDFQHMAAEGAEIVSGSQAHHAQTVAFNGEHFIHYGLGNLFFDQMAAANRPAFLDRHTFYAGRYINTELYSVMLEAGAQPRPMTAEERGRLLKSIFEVAVWQKIQ